MKTLGYGVSDGSAARDWPASFRFWKRWRGIETSYPVGTAESSGRPLLVVAVLCRGLLVFAVLRSMRLRLVLAKEPIVQYYVAHEPVGFQETSCEEAEHRGWEGPRDSRES